MVKRNKLRMNYICRLQVQNADCRKDTIHSCKQFCMKDALIHLYDSHWLLKQLLSVRNDVRHTVLSYGNLTAIYPLPQDIGSTFVLAGFLAQGVQLLLKIRYTRTLLFDFAVVFFIDGIHDLLHLKLVAHHSLCPPPLATRLEDMYTSALGCYQYNKIPK